MKNFYNIKMKFVKLLILCLILAIFNSTSLRRQFGGIINSPCTDGSQCLKTLHCCPDNRYKGAGNYCAAERFTTCTPGTMEPKKRGNR